MVRLHSVTSVAAPSAPAPGYPDTISGDADADSVFSVQAQDHTSTGIRTMCDMSYRLL